MCVLLRAKMLVPARVSRFTRHALRYLFLVNIFTKTLDFFQGHLNIKI